MARTLPEASRCWVNTASPAVSARRATPTEMGSSFPGRRGDQKRDSRAQGRDRRRVTAGSGLIGGELHHRPPSERSCPLAYESDRRIAGEALGLGNGLLRATEPLREPTLGEPGGLSRLTQQIARRIGFPGRDSSPSAQRLPLFVRPRLAPAQVCPRQRRTRARSHVKPHGFVRAHVSTSVCVGSRATWVRAKAMSESSAADASLRSARARSRARFGRWFPLDHNSQAL